ncbi:hypothetical protein [Amycolatopsis sp. NPDC004079]|uniref:hypothetical protein n=1 Tax=Amycolatopsis sp. NPDC004079 TaxID=3154549 RepID=UPI0033BD7709
MPPTSEQIEARIKECFGRWSQVCHSKDPVTVLAREVRDQRIVQMSNQGVGVGEISRRVGLGREGVTRVLKTRAALSSGTGAAHAD